MGENSPCIVEEMTAQGKGGGVVLNIMKKIPVEKAVGMILCHDITRIIPGKFKGRAFKKGHIIQEEDIEKLLELGKETNILFSSSYLLVV